MNGSRERDSNNGSDLTLFTIPKPFTGSIARLQLNALRSWSELLPATNIIVFGDDPGVAEAAAELGVRHHPHVETNDYGTPLLNGVFATAEAITSSPLLAYVNADIILLPDFVEAVTSVASRKSKFLMIGRRWNLDVESLMRFEPGWEENLRKEALARGDLQAPTWLDYFVFTRGLWEKIPPFAIGRTTWDNWLVYRARAQGAPVIDATQAVLCVHQNHDYSHLAGGQEVAWKGAEAIANYELSPGWDLLCNAEDATWRLSAAGDLSRSWGNRSIRKELRIRLSRWPVALTVARKVKRVLFPRQKQPLL